MTAPAPPAESRADVPTYAELKDEFDFLGNWEDRCEYLIDLGMGLPKLPADLKTERTRVHGCQSLVWMVVGERDGALDIAAESDAMIVNGLIAALLAVFDGKPPREALAVDVPRVFAELGLDEHLSSARKNGLFGMVKRIRGAAAELAGEKLAEGEEE